MYESDIWTKVREDAVVFRFIVTKSDGIIHTW
jgi:hypothetical protein